jgi:hypothetical protein
MFIKTNSLSTECFRICIYTLLFNIHDVSEEVNVNNYCLPLTDMAMLGVNLRILLLHCFILLFSLLLGPPGDYSDDP